MTDERQKDFVEENLPPRLTSIQEAFQQARNSFFELDEKLKHNLNTSITLPLLEIPLELAQEQYHIESSTNLRQWAQGQDFSTFLSTSLHDFSKIAEMFDKGVFKKLSNATFICEDYQPETGVGTYAIQEKKKPFYRRRPQTRARFILMNPVAIRMVNGFFLTQSGAESPDGIGEFLHDVFIPYCYRLKAIDGKFRPEQ